MEHGPITVLDVTQFDLSVEERPAEAGPTAEEAEFDGLLAELEHDLGELAGGLGQDWRTELELLHAEAEEGVYHDPLPAAVEELEGAPEAAVEADGLVVAAFDEMPGEAWQPVMAPYTPPPEAGGFVDTDPGAPPPAWLPPGVPAPQPPAPVMPTARLVNITRGTGTTFWVGDAWRLEVMGFPLSPVTCSGFHEGVPFGPASFGLTDDLGRWVHQGTMSEFERGYWVQEWSVGGVRCEPVVTFVVY